MSIAKRPASTSWSAATVLPVVTALSVLLPGRPALGQDEPAVRAPDVVASLGYTWIRRGDGPIPIYELGAIDAPSATSHDFPAELRAVLPVSHRFGSELAVNGGLTRASVDASALTAGGTSWVGSAGVEGRLFWRNPAWGRADLGYAFDWIDGGDDAFDIHIHSAFLRTDFYLAGPFGPYDFTTVLGYSREMPQLDLFDLHSDELDVFIGGRLYATDRVAVDLSIALTQFLGEPNETSLITIQGGLVWLPSVAMGRALTVTLAGGGGSYNLESGRGAPTGSASLTVAVHWVDVASLVELGRHY